MISLSPNRTPTPVQWLLIACLSIALHTVMLPFLPSPRYSILPFLVVELFLLQIALDLSELLTASMFHVRDLARLDDLGQYPPVAVLFLVCDDLLDEPLSHLGNQTYRNVDFFILDDSVSPPTKRMLDVTGYTVVRRENRSGFKAGNLNHWLARYGNRYKYFLVLDSDSILPSGFLDSMVHYAEHPDNRKVAVFNSLPCCWNRHVRFARLLSTSTPVLNWARVRLHNRLPSILSSGHNNLHRTSAVLEVGGFDEQYVAEDISLTLKLVQAGYTSCLVHLNAFEAEPCDLTSYTRRIRRWAEQNMQVQRADWRGIPLAMRWQMAMLLRPYFASSALLLALAAFAWMPGPGPASVSLSWSAIVAGRVAAGSAFLAVAPWLLVSLLPHMLRLPLALRSGVSAGDYVAGCLLSTLLGLSTMVEIFLGQLHASVTDRIWFRVTEKRSSTPGLASVLQIHWRTAVVSGLVAVGFWQSTHSLAFSLILGLPFVGASALLCALQSDHREPGGRVLPLRTLAGAARRRP